MAENKTPEFEPPQACVQRVIKAVLPDNVQIGKDAKAAFSRSAGIFIMYLTACANDFCREAKRQTISAQDVMQAIKELEFGELEEPLREYLDQYRREASAKKQSKLGAGGGAVAKKGDTGDIDEGEGDGDQGVGGEGEAEEGMGDDADGGDRERDGGDIAQQINSGAGSATNNGSSSSAEGVKMEMDRRQSAGGPQGSVGGGFPMEEDPNNVVQVVGAPVASVAASAGGMIPQEIAGSETNAG